jgi:hypothetical protein
MPEPIVFAYDSELVPLVPVSPNIGKVTVVGAISHFLGAEEIDRAERDDRRDAIRAFNDADANRLSGWSQTFIHRDHARPDPTLCRKLISDGVAPGVFVDVFRSADYTSETTLYTRIFRSTRVGTGTLLVPPHHGGRFYEALFLRDDHAVRCHVFGLSDDDLATFLNHLTVTLPPPGPSETSP